MQRSERREMKAILNSDLEILLKKFEQYDDFIQKKLTCSVCDQTTTEDTVGSVQLKDNKLIFICNNPSCYNQLVKEQMKDKL